MLPIKRFQEVFPNKTEEELHEIRQRFYLLARLALDNYEERITTTTMEHDEPKPSKEGRPLPSGFRPKAG